MASLDCKGMCKNCGFLGIRERSPDLHFDTGRPVVATAPVYEVTPESRERGNLFGVPSTQDGTPEVAIPICVRGVPLVREAGGKFNAESGMSILEKRRNCELWTIYQCGLSPREHIAIMVLERLEESRQEWDSKWADRNQQDARRHHLTMVLLTFLAIAATVLVASPDTVLGRLIGLSEVDPEPSAVYSSAQPEP